MGKLKPVEFGHDNITHHTIYSALMLLAPAERLCTISGRKDRKPNSFKSPLQEVSKVIVVFDDQNGNGTAVGRYEVKPQVGD